ncbi:MAG: hypothetical protein ACJ72Z_03015 [Pyrinomonadaceae bacterium]
MAFIDQDNEDPQGYSSFYNVNSSVGTGGQNMEEDVKVVQFFLKRYYTIQPDQKPYGEMSTDGKCGPITRAWIKKFQWDAQRAGIVCSSDGLIDKAGNESSSSNWVSSMSKTKYTIRILNNVLRGADTFVYKTLTTNPVVPPDLKMIFLQIQSQGPAMNYGDA